MLIFWIQHLKFINDTFDCHPKMVAAMTKAIHAAVKNSPRFNSNAELPASYCDKVLKNTKRNKAEIFAHVKDSLLIVNYLDDKDLDQNKYFKLIAEILLLQPCIAAEKAFLSMMKETNGSFFPL